MAYEALDNLQQTLDQILEYREDLVTPSVKQEILSIRVQAAVLQLNLKLYPNKEKIREAANTAYEIIEYFFFGEYLLDCGSTEPTVILANKLRELAERLESTVGDVVDYIKGKGVTDSADVSSLSRSAITSSKDDFVVGVDKDVKVIMDRLLEGSTRLRVIPIVGTGGIGATGKGRVRLVGLLTCRREQRPLCDSTWLCVCVIERAIPEPRRSTPLYSFVSLFSSLCFYVAGGGEGLPPPPKPLPPPPLPQPSPPLLCCRCCCCRVAAAVAELLLLFRQLNVVD